MLSAVTAAAAAIGDRVIECSRCSAGADGHVRSETRIECAVDVGDYSVVAAAASSLFCCEFCVKLVAHASDISRNRAEAVLGLLVPYVLCAELAFDAVHLAVEVLVHFKELLIGVGVRITLCNAGFECVDLAYKSQFIAVDYLVFTDRSGVICT